MAFLFVCLFVCFPCEIAFSSILRIKTIFFGRHSMFREKEFQFWTNAYTDHIWRAWYNGSYTMMAKPIKTLEMHYPMMQFLIDTAARIVQKWSSISRFQRESGRWKEIFFRDSNFEKRFARLEINMPHMRRGVSQTLWDILTPWYRDPFYPGVTSTPSKSRDVAIQSPPVVLQSCLHTRNIVTHCPFNFRQDIMTPDYRAR